VATIRFAAIGLNHDHIYGQCQALIAAGAELAGYHTDEDALAVPFEQAFPGTPRVAEARALLEDESVALITSAAISDERAGIAIAAMRHGKDVLMDKPGAVTFDQLAVLERVQAETGRIYAVYFSEHFATRSTVKAGELVAAGAIGRVIHVTGLGPHRLRKAARPRWFFERARYGGILCDIGAHQFEQFLFFTGAREARVLSATVANRANPDEPELQDFGDVHLETESATGYHRLDWFTPDGLPTWGDGRLILCGTEGTIELRKYFDIAGRPGADHLFLSDRKQVVHIDCSETPLPFAPALLNDIRDRTETAMPQAHCFAAMRLALTAQKIAEERGRLGGGSQHV
jgi:predicted dehydrogenase